MSAPVRFLIVVVSGWVLLRGVTAGYFPGAEVFTMAKAETAPAPVLPVVPTEFPPIAPVQPAPAPSDYGYYPASHPASSGPRYIAAPVYYYPAYTPSRSTNVPLPPPHPATELAPSPQFYSALPTLEQFDVAQLSTPMPSWRSRSSSPQPVPAAPIASTARLDRLQLSAWALLRGQPSTGTLATASTLGGSQAGARLTYAFDRRLAASVRSSTPVGGVRGGEVAAGVRLTPIPSIPVAITAERRQAIGQYSTGRSAFALFAEGGIYGRPIGWGLALDGYAQAGVVDFGDRDFFADGGLTVSRPVYGRFSLGLGAWGGYQPGLYRVDAGPRLSMRVRPNVSFHLDWRQRLAGAAEPASGPALTLGANF